MKERIHPIVRKVEYSYLNKDEIPKKHLDKKQIYAIYWDNSIIGIGETSDIRQRIPGGYRWKIQSDLFDGSTIIEGMKQIADSLPTGEVFKFSVKFLEQVDRGLERLAEKKWINFYRDAGEPILNRTK